MNNNNSNNTSSHISPTRYAAHLSEFYSIVNNTSPKGDNTLAPPNPSHGALKENDHYNPRLPPASLRSGMSSISDLRTLITKRDIKNTVDAMDSLFNSSKGYAQSLQEVSNHASSMAQSLETLARLKGCSDDAAERMLSASGLFYLLANHENIMSQCVQVALGDDLLNEMDKFQIKSKTMENEFKKHCKDESMKLKLQERHNIKLSRRKTRNLMLYKESLMNLQTQLDQIESLRHDYYQNSYDLVESTCDKVLDNVATVSRARVEISENIARKGWSGGGLDDLLMDAEDPFGKDEDPGDEEVNDEIEQQENEVFDPVEEVEQGSLSNDEVIAEDKTAQGQKSLKHSTKDDRNSINNSNFLQGPPTPVRKMSPLGAIQSPLGHKSGSTRGSTVDASGSSHSPRFDIADPADSTFDNSFSLPLAGSARSRERDDDDRDDLDDNNNILKDLSTLKLDETSSCSSIKEKRDK